MPHDRFRQFIDNRSEFLILSHLDPDADAIGSCLGLAWALRGMGRVAEVVTEETLPESLRFLPGSDTVRRPADVGKVFEAAFVVDCSDLTRVGAVSRRLLAPDAAIASIDHHVANDGFGEPRLVNVEASSTAELVYEVLDAYGVPLESEIAACLYAGIVSDTGGFRFQNTSPRALRIAARLIEHGARPSWTADALYAKKSAPSLRILGLALSTLESRSQGQVGALTLSREMFAAAGAAPEDADGIVQFAKALNGARVGVLIQEAAVGEVRLSFRSDGSVDVNQVAGRFGGGGHRNAAGARVKGGLAEVKVAVLEALDLAVNGGPPAPRG
jgi:phosphoesterase RecJ-like protein